jgi:hypothetical protein
MLGSWRETYVKPHLPVPLPLHMDELVLKETRVARWHILKPNIPIWQNFGGSCSGAVGILNGHLVYFTAIWYSLRPFGIFYGYLVHIFFSFMHVVPRKIWQP